MHHHLREPHNLDTLRPTYILVCNNILQKHRKDGKKYYLNESHVYQHHLLIMSLIITHLLYSLKGTHHQFLVCYLDCNKCDLDHRKRPFPLCDLLHDVQLASSSAEKALNTKISFFTRLNLETLPHTSTYLREIKRYANKSCS
jgi:hypothetical protein